MEEKVVSSEVEGAWSGRGYGVAWRGLARRGTRGKARGGWKAEVHTDLAAFRLGSIIEEQRRGRERKRGK